MPPDSRPLRARFRLDRDEVLARAGQLLGWVRGPSDQLEVTSLDTFDWRLFRAGARLSLEEGRQGARLLWWRGSERLLLPVQAPVRFATDLPTSTLRRRLEEVAGIRALLPVGRATVRRRSARVVDREGKTVATVLLETTQRHDPRGARVGTASRTVLVEGFQGYEAAFDTTVSRLAALEGLAPAEGDELAEAAAAWGRQPGDVPSRLELPLRPHQPAGEAVRLILRALLEAILANREGVVEDLDTEFLHDLRVAVRRTRSALRQLGGVLPSDEVAHLEDEFRWLASVTGTCRDLDVFRLAVESYLRTGSGLAAALGPFLAHLAQHRAAAHRELVRALAGRRFSRLVQRLEALLASPPAGGGEPIGAVAGRAIQRVHARLLRAGQRVGHGPDAALLHRVRIEGKRLRYLLEFFASLYPPGRIGPLVARLKALQDALGGFHDAVVHTRRLLAMAEEMGTAGLGSPATFLAMGRLASWLEAQGEAHRQQFEEVFQAFSSAPSRRLRVLLQPEEGPS